MTLTILPWLSTDRTIWIRINIVAANCLLGNIHAIHNFKGDVVPSKGHQQDTKASVEKLECLGATAIADQAGIRGAHVVSHTCKELLGPMYTQSQSVLQRCGVVTSTALHRQHQISADDQWTSQQLRSKNEQ